MAIDRVLATLRRGASRATLRATVPLSRWLGPSGPACFGLLMYHRVSDRVAGLPRPTWNVTPRRFDQQLSYLLRHGYTPWRLGDLVNAHRAGQPIPRRLFVVTFDDGYECLLTRALPILERWRVPATFFLSTGLMGRTGPMPQDDWLGAGDPRVPKDVYQALTLEQCDQLARHPLIELGCHTHSHQDFRGRPHAFAEDIRTSAEMMRQRWGLESIPFSYPYGNTALGYCSDAMVRSVQSCGFTCGLTADAQIADPTRQGPYRWSRLHVEQADSGPLLAAKIDNWYGRFRALTQFGPLRTPTPARSISAGSPS
jgi:peptidoglycan/xylan/chitin deacetylase (PgdA/CDA1 family)